MDRQRTEMESALGFLKRFFAAFGSGDKRPRTVLDEQSSEFELEAEQGPPEEVVMEIGDVLDLHSFPPKQVKDLVRDYLDHAIEHGWHQVRIIHGKGIGVQRRTVRAILEKDPRVEAFGDPPGESGGWGATWVQLRSNPPDRGP